MLLEKSSSTRLFCKALLCSVLASALGGCVDYLKRSDTVSLSAGETQAWNKIVHVADPWPPYVMDTRIQGDGQRTAGVIQRYSTGVDEPRSVQAAESAGDAVGGSRK
jgi:hypothetical protein